MKTAVGISSTHIITYYWVLLILSIRLRRVILIVNLLKITFIYTPSFNLKYFIPVIPHQDITYLHTEPVAPIGFWIALEDATIQNSCLWVVRGSHKSGVHRRLVRSPNKDGKNDVMVYDKPNPFYPESSFIPLPVSKGKYNHLFVE